MRNYKLGCAVGLSINVLITPYEAGAAIAQCYDPVKAANVAISEADCTSPLIWMGADTTAPTVTLTGPEAKPTGQFTMSVKFSEQVTGFTQDEVTVTNGSIDGFFFTGLAASVTITPTELGKAVKVDVAKDVAEDEAGNKNTAATQLVVETVSTGSQSPSASQEADPLLPTVQATAPRQLTSTITSNQRLIREGRTRFIQSRRQMRGDSAGISSRNSVDFEFDGTLNATNGYISSQGAFFQQDGNFEGTSRRVLFGDFDIQRSSDTGSTTATFTGKMAWERMLDEQNMIGYYVGADVARSNIKGTYTGEQDTYGISVGTYFVSALQENLFLDGFVSVGVGKNDLTLADGTVDLNGDFNSRSVTLGTALTGVIKQEGYEIWPELAFTYGKTRLGTIGMTDRLAAVANNSVTVDAGDVSIANLTLRPEYRMPMDGLASVDSLSLFTFAPRLLCEQVETTAKSKNCGGGAEFGIDRTSEDGRSRFVARIKADRIAKVTRSALELKFEHRF